MELEEQLRKHLAQRIFPGSDPDRLGLDDDLLELIDSIELIRVVAHIERTYGIEVADHDMHPQNLSSARKMADMIRRAQRR
jgi:acyl carrier protein